MEYRQNQLRLQQLYVQTRIQVINSQYALTNDRAQVQSANAARDFARRASTRNRRSTSWELRRRPTCCSRSAIWLEQRIT